MFFVYQKILLIMRQIENNPLNDINIVRIVCEFSPQSPLINTAFAQIWGESHKFSYARTPQLLSKYVISMKIDETFTYFDKKFLNVVRLDICNNLATFSDIKQRFDIQKIEYLELYGADIDIIDRIAYFSNLRDLFINDKTFDDGNKTKRSIHICSDSLIKLHIQRKNVTDIIAPNLRELHIEENFDGKLSKSDFINLTTLNCGRHKFNAKDIMKLKNLRELTTSGAIGDFKLPENIEIYRNTTCVRGVFNFSKLTKLREIVCEYADKIILPDDRIITKNDTPGTYIANGKKIVVCNKVLPLMWRPGFSYKSLPMKPRQYI